MHRQTVAARLDNLGYQPHETSTAKNQLYWFDSDVEFAIKAAKDELDAVRIRDLRAAAEIKELKLSRERGEVVDIADVMDRVQAIFTRLYKESTQMQPKRLGSRLAKAKTVAEVTRILKADTDKVLAKAAEMLSAYIAAHPDRAAAVQIANGALRQQRSHLGGEAVVAALDEAGLLHLKRLHGGVILFYAKFAGHKSIASSFNYRLYVIVAFWTVFDFVERD